MCSLNKCLAANLTSQYRDERRNNLEDDRSMRDFNVHLVMMIRSLRTKSLNQKDGLFVFIYILPHEFSYSVLTTCIRHLKKRQ